MLYNRRNLTSVICLDTVYSNWPYQVLPLKVDPGTMAMKGTPYSLNLQYYRRLTIILFNILSRILTLTLGLLRSRYKERFRWSRHKEKDSRMSPQEKTAWKSSQGKTAWMSPQGMGERKSLQEKAVWKSSQRKTAWKSPKWKASWKSSQEKTAWKSS